MARGRRRTPPARRNSTQGLNQAAPPARSDEPAVATRITESSYSGPLPPSTELEAYDRVLPGAAERIFSMAESFAAHTQHLEVEAMRQERSAQRWGRNVAAAVVLAILGTCIYALRLGHEEFATTLGSWTIVALAAVFVAGKVPRARSLKNK